MGFGYALARSIGWTEAATRQRLQLARTRSEEAWAREAANQEWTAAERSLIQGHVAALARW